jgi:diacylglycerol kinase family enzyme
VRLCPYAQLNDGLLDVVVGRSNSKTKMIDVFEKAKKDGAHIYDPCITYYRGKYINLKFNETFYFQSE